jgi:hypothetical protein
MIIKQITKLQVLSSSSSIIKKSQKPRYYASTIMGLLHATKLLPKTSLTQKHPREASTGTYMNTQNYRAKSTDQEDMKHPRENKKTGSQQHSQKN